jgi:aminomethyltransferase
VSRTGYTGEPVCFELFVQASNAPAIWDLLTQRGATPIGLGARDTLRLEAGLPLYGHELGEDPEGQEIPIFSCPPSRFAVSFSSSKGRYIGRGALEKQFEELRRINDHRFTDIRFLSRRIFPVAMVDRGVARAGNAVLFHDRQQGWVTSGTMVPYWKMEGSGASSRLSQHTGMRAIGLALVDSRLGPGDVVSIDIRGKKAEAVLVSRNLQSDVAPYAGAILHGRPG